MGPGPSPGGDGQVGGSDGPGRNGGSPNRYRRSRIPVPDHYTVGYIASLGHSFAVADAVGVTDGDG